MALHVVLAPEALAADVAVVEAPRGVAPLVNEEVVRLREGPLTPPAVVCFG